jgi:hypothetical protein
MSWERFVGALTGAQFLAALQFPGTPLDLTGSAVQARGWLAGTAGASAALLPIVLFAYAAGRFLFGDVRPSLRQRKGLDPEAPTSAWVGWIAAVLAGLPPLPALLAPALAGAARLPVGPAATALLREFSPELSCPLSFEP